MIKHALNNPYILTTGLAAYIHSTWALSTLFTGYGPAITNYTTLLSWLWWILPGALIAFALDVGQIATSAELREGQRNPAKFITFGIFAVATYILQWLYMAHHMPSLTLSEGVRPEWIALARLLRDSSLWIIPAFLPLSTIAYTFSSREELRPENKDDSQPVKEQLIISQVTDLLEAEILPAPKARKTRTSPSSSNGNGHHVPAHEAE